jgi:hypothetical protein
MKGQTLVIQFILFFIIGLALFLTVGNFFKLQFDVARSDIINSNLRIVSSYVSSAIINLVDSCKQCEYANVMLGLENKTGYAVKVQLSSNPRGLNISTEDKFYFSPIHNLNETFDMSGESSSFKTLSLTLNRTKNELRVE